ncbi:hypothetical protein LX16_1236 [Stackebrandtia albiflava]|uniref:Uncharacterized protein n=1 Tax=Stackebrandtia albiflava TaxID=406432 RepID=A0A562VCB2_9ACTN|nr:hypothetical protein [Stackebrandtia albiflava]TWJ15525.1 hypothetical protein LX16_1236 [Stackebrandtia albiflava]
MVDVTVEVSGGAAVAADVSAWIARIPSAAELGVRFTGESLTATVSSPPQLATLAMAVATFLRTRPVDARPTVTATAVNGESLELTTTPDPNRIRSAYIAMDRRPAPAPDPGPDVVDAEIVEP